VISDSYFERFETAKYRNPNRLQRALIGRFVGHLHALFVRACPVDSVLEVGCGEGFISGYLSERFPHTRFAGLELDGHDLALLRRKFERIEARQGSVYDLATLYPPAAGSAFDLIVCCEVLEHLDRPAEALEQMRALGPKRLILTVPHEPWFRLSNMARGKNVARLGNDLDHRNHWGRRSFRRQLESHFDVIELTSSYPWLLALVAPK